MAGYWILKTEPSTYSFADLVKAKRAVWDGVANPVALKNLRAMAKGDDALIYHTGDEKAVVGVATILSAAYPDPKQKDPRFVVVDIKAVRPLKRAVTLAEIKADPAFADLALVRQGRLSVVPASAAQWHRLVKLGGG